MVLPHSTVEFVRHACIGHDWNATRYERFYFREYTPCFNDVVVVSGVHLSFFIVCAIRLYQLHDDRRAKVRLQNRAMYILRLVACIIAALCPAFEFMSKLSNMGSVGRTTNPYGTSSATNTLLPFEYISFSVLFAAYTMLAVVLGFEIRYTVLRGTWLIRFASLFGLAALSVRLEFYLELYRRADRPFDFYAYNFFVQYAAVGILGLIGALYWPSSDRFDAMEYVLLPMPEPKSPVAHSDVCPELSSGLWGRLTFSWMNPLVKLGASRPLEAEDLWKLDKYDRAARNQERFAKLWKEERGTAKPWLVRVFWRLYGWEIFVSWFFKAFNDGSQFVGPIFLKALIQNTATGGNLGLGLALAFGMFAGQIVGAVMECQYFNTIQRVGLKIRSGLILAIFRQATVLDPEQRDTFSSGKITNMISSDCENLYWFTGSMLNLWSSPIRIIVAVVLLYEEVGVASFVAVGLLVIMMPVQKKLVSMSSALLKKSLGSTDERVKLVGEVLGAMDVVKCYAWESSLMKRVDATRDIELSWIKKRAILNAFNSFLISSIPVMVSVFTFLVYIALGNELTAGKAFTALSLLSVLRMPLIMLPSTINQAVAAGVALGRIKSFLEAHTLSSDAKKTTAKAGEAALEVEKTSFCWSQKDGVTLKDVSLKVMHGELLSIIGSTGSGKSSLLSALLGEMLPTGRALPGDPVLVRGSVAYVNQQAWIFNATIRENILFGKPYDPRRYAEAVSLASLVRDFQGESMAFGDLTEIGEKGVNLSGGQKQRVSIARAIYADADVILLDDPLSALDAHVAKEIYDRCINGHWRQRGKTVVFVTNRLEFVQQSDNVAVVDGGSIVAWGAPAELSETSVVYRELMKSEAGTDSEGPKGNTSDGPLDIDVDEILRLIAPAPAAPRRATTSKGDKSINADSDDDDLLDPSAPQPPTQMRGQLTTKETHSTGGVGAKLLRQYSVAMGGMWVLWMILLTFMWIEGLRLYASIWIQQWTSDMADGSRDHPNTYYIGVYGGISAGQTIVTLVNLLIVAFASVHAGRQLHSKMLTALLRAPMSFFTATPIGRIMNRVSKDVADIDRQLASMSTVFVRGVIQILGVFVIIGMATPYTLAAFVPVLTVFYWTYRYFQYTNRALKRLDSVARSPIYSFFGQCLSGLATIRAFHAAEQVAVQSAERVDGQARFMLALVSSNRWLSLRLEMLGGLMILVTAVLLVIGADSGAVSPSTVGLSLSYALQITGLLNMIVRLAAIAENSFNSVERVIEYGEVEPEAVEAPLGAAPPPCDWPARGHIKFEGVSMKYRADLPPVLKSLDFEATPAQKIGIVGRTGAGKSSTFLTLFRIVEPCEGTITIDDVDISRLSMFALRSKLSLIPQDPVLFAGSVRFNLDPFNDYDEHVLWSALERAHLKEFVLSMDQGLDSKIVENGANFSVGQRQLICLARALVRRSSILVLDEATAAVDVGTDALIQKTIREEFAHCTVLAIAHRLNTIIDSDRILVLDAGEKVEFDTPANLLANDNGIFAGMVNSTGKKNAQFLRDVAFGNVDMNDILRTEAQASEQSVKVRCRTVADMSAAQYADPQLESTRLGVLQIKRAIEGSQSSRFQESLEALDLTSDEWLQDLRSVLEELVRLATEHVGDGAEYSSVEALQNQQLGQVLLQH